MALKQCKIHGPFNDEPIMVFGRPVSFGCPACAEERRLAVEGVPVENYEVKYSEMGIPQNLFEASFENAVRYSREFEANMDTVRKLVDGSVLSIIMTGSPGTGKTYLAVCALKAVGGKLFTMYDLSVRIRSTYSPRAKETELDIISELVGLPLLVIDELGRTKGSEAELNWLSAVIDKRYSRRLRTILISNRHTAADCPRNGCPQCLENYIPNDAVSRLSSSGAFIRFTGDDFRMRVSDNTVKCHQTNEKGPNFNRFSVPHKNYYNTYKTQY